MNPLAARCLPLLDLTDLADSCRALDIARLCERAVTPHGPVAAVCVWPRFVSQAATLLRQTPVRIASVVNFPRGGPDIDASCVEAVEAVRDGAGEIDLVMPWRAVLAGDVETARDLVAAVRDALPAGTMLKVILESGSLADPAPIAAAGEAAIAAGADMLKTSTGKTAVSATPEAARIMLDAIRRAGRPVGFKASGGIRTLADAASYLALADDVMGPDWVGPTTFRFGASSLLDALLLALDAPP